MQNPYFAKFTLIASAVGVIIIMYVMQEFLIGSFAKNIACAVVLLFVLILFFGMLNSFKKRQNKGD